jgi:O-antigen/teichoic acid export membrane protein
MPQARRNSIVLVLLSIGGFVLSYLTSMVLANVLGAGGFDDYAVAVASLAMLATLAEGGTGKYALAHWPKLIERGEHRQAAGFWRFALGAVVVASLAIGILVGGLETAADGRFANYAVGEAAIFLPAVALAGMGAELVTALGGAVGAALVARVITPGVSLGIAGWWWWRGWELTAPHAVVIFAAGWIVRLRSFRATSPPPTPPALTPNPLPSPQRGLYLTQSSPHWPSPALKSPRNPADSSAATHSSHARLDFIEPRKRG